MNKNDIIKPITVAYDDFINELLKLINNSHLPFFIIETVLKDFITEVHQGTQQQLQEDKMRYNKELLESQDDNIAEEKEE